MAKHIIAEDQSNTVIVSESGSEWVLNKGVLLSAAVGIDNYGHDLVRFTIGGRIDSADIGVNFIAAPGSGDTADHATVVVAAKGRIFANADAVRFEGSGAFLDNAGLITCGAQGVVVDGGDIEIRNTGTISSGQKVVSIQGASFLIRNDGELIRTEDGSAIQATVTTGGSLVNGRSGVIDGAVDFYDSAGDITVRNRGSISFDEATTPESIYLGSGDDSLVNRGRIIGDISLGAGSDLADFRHGRLTKSTVHGDAGDDLFIIDKAGIVISELFDGGSDTIRTSVSYSLGNSATGHVETLVAIGRNNIALTGNDRDNIIKGNAADNVLSGGDGDDKLLGLRGNDTMTGGDGADHFYFYDKGGNDTITEFSLDADTIHIIQIAGIEDFDTLQSRIDGSANGQNTVIDLGAGGKLTLIGINSADLEAGHFAIFA